MNIPVNVPVNEPEPGIFMAFDHEKLDVYQLAMDFIPIADGLITKLPKGRGYLSDQLQRASLSIVLNIAEGAGKYSPRDKSAYYTRARGSASESAAVLDVLYRLGFIDQDEFNENKIVLQRIAQMLTKLALRK